MSTAEAVSVAELLTSSPVVDATIPKLDSVSASFCTSPLEVSEINPHSTAASTNASTWSLPFSTPSVSNVYLKSVSVSPRSFRASAFFFTSFPNLEVSFPDKASLNLFAEIADSFNWSRTSENWSANSDIPEFFSNDCTALSTASNSVDVCLTASELPSVNASLYASTAFV